MRPSFSTLLNVSILSSFILSLFDLFVQICRMVDRKFRFQSATLSPCLSAGASRCRKRTVSFTDKLEFLSSLFSTQWRIAFMISSQTLPSWGFEVIKVMSVCSSICFWSCRTRILWESSLKIMQMFDVSRDATSAGSRGAPFGWLAFSVAYFFSSLTKVPAFLSTKKWCPFSVTVTRIRSTAATWAGVPFTTPASAELAFSALERYAVTASSNLSWTACIPGRGPGLSARTALWTRRTIEASLSTREELCEAKVGSMTCATCSQLEMQKFSGCSSRARFMTSRPVTRAGMGFRFLWALEARSFSMYAILMLTGFHMRMASESNFSDCSFMERYSGSRDSLVRNAMRIRKFTIVSCMEGLGEYSSGRAFAAASFASSSAPLGSSSFPPFPTLRALAAWLSAFFPRPFFSAAFATGAPSAASTATFFFPCASSASPGPSGLRFPPASGSTSWLATSPFRILSHPRTTETRSMDSFRLSRGLF